LTIRFALLQGDPIFYFLLLLGDLLARQFQTDLPYLEYFFKPALMISLGIYFYRQSDALKQGRVDYFLLSAIAFSCLGDILLMFDGQFILGLASFLLAHVSYIFAFLADNKGLVYNKKGNYLGQSKFRYFLLASLTKKEERWFVFRAKPEKSYISPFFASEANTVVN
jgi:hypothetical protein